jgi:prepilin-type N-terminal cleavage/methylation domain-containing protein/prepilin-type processing-associated H-X9-DG protein
MRKKKAFTLIELLVVISIIALLLAILIPSLNRAMELARRIICGSHLKTLTKGSSAYATAHGGWFVPAGYSPYYDSDSPGTPPEQNSCNWVSNVTYRKYIDIDNYKTIQQKGIMQSPKEFLCPSDKISIDPDNVSQYGVLTSYAYNVTDWNPWSGGSGNGWKNRIVGHRVDSINEPADKLNFIDGIDWWTDWVAANYKNGWDKLGQRKSDDYRNSAIIGSPLVYGPVFYRHNEGAVIGFYDGHADYMKKQKVFVIEDYGAIPKRAGMWTSSGRMPK